MGTRQYTQYRHRNGTTRSQHRLEKRRRMLHRRHKHNGSTNRRSRSISVIPPRSQQSKMNSPGGSSPRATAFGKGNSSTNLHTWWGGPYTPHRQCIFRSFTGVFGEECCEFVHCGESVPVTGGGFNVDRSKPDLDTGVVVLVKSLQSFQGCRTGGLGFQD